MKKLLVVALVLGMASMANAALQLYVNGAPVDQTVDVVIGQTIMLGLGDSEATTASLGAFLDLGPRPGAGGLYTIGVAALTAIAPADSNFSGYEADYGTPIYEFSVNVFSFTPGVQTPAGVSFIVPLTAAAEGVVNVELYNGFDLADTLTISQIVPEPMTMSLLALGGLGLLRRRG